MKMTNRQERAYHWVQSALAAGYTLEQAIYTACCKYAETYEQHATLTEFLEACDW